MYYFNFTLYDYFSSATDNLNLSYNKFLTGIYNNDTDATGVFDSIKICCGYVREYPFIKE
jgi:hypothetical protein